MFSWNTSVICIAGKRPFTCGIPPISNIQMYYGKFSIIRPDDIGIVEVSIHTQCQYYWSKDSLWDDIIFYSGTAVLLPQWLFLKSQWHFYGIDEKDA